MHNRLITDIQGVSQFFTSKNFKYQQIFDHEDNTFLNVF